MRTFGNIQIRNGSRKSVRELYRLFILSFCVFGLGTSIESHAITMDWINQKVVQIEESIAWNEKTKEAGKVIFSRTLNREWNRDYKDLPWSNLDYASTLVEERHFEDGTTEIVETITKVYFKNGFSKEDGEKQLICVGGRNIRLKNGTIQYSELISPEKALKYYQEPIFQVASLKSEMVSGNILSRRIFEASILWYCMISADEWSEWKKVTGDGVPLVNLYHLGTRVLGLPVQRGQDSLVKVKNSIPFNSKYLKLGYKSTFLSTTLDGRSFNHVKLEPEIRIP